MVVNELVVKPLCYLFMLVLLVAGVFLFGFLNVDNGNLPPDPEIVKYLESIDE